MKDKYTKTNEYWNDIFEKVTPFDPSVSISNEGLEKSIKWLSDGSKSALDFGCGSGKVVIRTLSYGVEKAYGIDLSQSAIDVACKVIKENDLHDKAKFCCGSIDKLQEFEDDSIDSAILYNIVDNLAPDDAASLLREIHRIVSPNGKILIKLNPLLSDDQITEYDIQRISGNFLKEPYGIYLWNQATDEWKSMFHEYFTVEKYEEILYPEHEMINRMFYLRNR